MTDDKENKKTDTPPANSGDGREDQPLRKISDDELQTILAEHKKWLETKGGKGQKARFTRMDLEGVLLEKADLRRALFTEVNLRFAIFSGANLSEAQMFRVDLREADFAEANLQGARLHHVDLRKARLRETNLSNATLSHCKFGGADLSRADLSGAEIRNVTGFAKAKLNDSNFEGATGLKGTEFARADITGAKLPEDIREFKSLAIVEELSKNARKIFLAMLLGCAYAWLTILTTTDAKLILNSASSPLPIIRTEIPIAYFYLAAPFILIGLFVYLHLYLQRLWEALAKLPARFEDGKSLDERAYPWLLNGLVRRHFEKLKRDRLLMPRIEELTSILLAWCVVPLTLGAFWCRYLWRHDWTGTSLHIGLIVLSAAAAVLFYRSHACTLRGTGRPAFPWLRFYRDRRTYQTVAVGVIGMALVIGSIGAINGLLDSDGTGHVYSWAYADLSEAQLSHKHPDYWSLDPAVRDSAVIGANLNGVNLRDAYLSRAFLVNANLRRAILTSAKLFEADLSYANLTNADLRGADLLNADLSYADLTRADLRGADLRGANLRRADLTGADFTGAQMSQADLAGADLSSEGFFRGGANLAKALGLTQSQLDDACGDSLTKVPPGLTVWQCPEE